MKKLLFTLFVVPFLTVPTFLFAIDSVRIAANGETADAVTIADQKIEVSSLSVVQIISSGTIISNSSASITTNNQMAVTVSTNFVVLNPGFLGIGTNGMPSSKLDIVGGTVTISGTNARLRLNSNSGTGATAEIGAGTIGMPVPNTSLILTGRPNLTAVPTLLWDTGTNGQGFMIENQAGRADFYTNGDSFSGVMSMLSNNVRIGSLGTPSSKLDVDGGSITVRGTNAGLAITGAAGAGNGFNLLAVSTGATNLFTVSGTSIVAAVDIYKNATAYANPDYVFEKDYKLMSIDELRQFIKKNKHLPNMSSTAEINKKGVVNLTETNRLLIEKVEELYLYVFEQEERLARLESLIGVAYTHK